MATEVGMRVVWSGIPQLRRAMPLKAARLAEDTARHIEAEAKANIVAMHLVVTGFLLNSVISTPEHARRWLVTVGAYYGAYLNYGTRYISPRPFFEQAVESGRRYLRANGARLMS